jgi:succinate dehydrogenase / fumarate reductase flavoprotein subunit
MWDNVGMSRNAEGLKTAIEEIKKLKEEFYNDLFIPGKADELNPELEKATKVADFIELGELMAHDALQRNESCGGHFREEYQSSEGEALRDDTKFAFVGAWEWDENGKHQMHKEELKFENVELKTRSYK